MKKQPFTIGGSVALKKALVEKTGVRVYNEESATEWDYLEATPEYPNFMQGGSTKESTHYQLPQDWDKAVAAVKDFFAKEKFEKGKWYYGEIEEYKFLLKYKDTRPIYNKEGKICYNDILYSEFIKVFPTTPLTYSVDNYMSNTKLEQALQPATQEQIQFMLGKVAVQKGFVEGAKVRSLFANNIDVIDDGFNYEPSTDSLWINGNNNLIEIYEKGKWAELLPQEEVQWSYKVGDIITVIKKNGEIVHVAIFKCKEDNKYSFINLTKKHICVCKFNTVEEALDDLEEQVKKGLVQSYHPASETLVLQGVKVKLPFHEQKCTIELNATHLQQLQAYFTK
jgi:hypothetical protein